jgi:hypothetical protein
MKKNSLSTYVTVYKDVDDITRNALHYRNVSVFLPITVSFNVSGHRDPMALATDLIRLWDILIGRDELVDRFIPGDIFLYFLRSMSNSHLLHNMGLRIVGLAGYPDFDLDEWVKLEAVVSHLITLDPGASDGMTYPVSMAEHFANVTRHAQTTHLWIFGQGDFAAPGALQVISDMFERGDVPDLISLAIGHSIVFYGEADVLHDALQMRFLEAISGTIYHKDYLRHMPEHGKRWWPHQESAMHEARTRPQRTRHLELGKGDADPSEVFVYVEPNPNWNKDQSVRDDVFIERYQVCLENLSRPSDRFSWYFTMADLEYCDGLERRGRMPAAQLAAFWAAMATENNSAIRLQPAPFVIIPFKGDMGQQILAAAAYFKLKVAGHAVYADLSGILRPGFAGSASESVWQLEPFGLGMHIFEPRPAVTPRTVYSFDSGGAHLAQFGLDGLANPGILAFFDSATRRPAPETRLARFEGRPYAFIHLPAARANDAQLAALLARTGGFLDNAVVLCDAAADSGAADMIGSFFREVVVLGDGATFQNHMAMRKARLLVGSDSWFDLSAAALNQDALGFMLQDWRTQRDPVFVEMLNSVSPFQVAGGHAGAR